MATCTNPKAFSDQVNTWIREYEKIAQDDTLEGIDSTPVSETLDRLYAYRRAIKNKDYDFIRAQGFSINDRKKRGELATQVFLDTFGPTFFFKKGTSSKQNNALFQKAELVDGGVRIHYKNEGKNRYHTFSLTTDERSTNLGKSFINVPGFRDFLDNFSRAEDSKMGLELVLGSQVGADFTLKDKDIEENYIHGNIQNMKDMLKKLHILGGEKADDNELAGFMDLLDKMRPKFFEDLKLFVQEKAETSKGVARPTRIDIKIKGDPISIGNQQSEASIYMEEVVHSMTMGAISADTTKSRQLVRRLDKLVELGRKQLTVEDFLPDPKDSIDPKKEREFAKNLYNYIFLNKNTRYEFLAKGIAQPLVAKALSKVKVRDTAGSRTILERIYDLWELVQDILTGQIITKNRNQTVDDALIQLAFELGEINTKASQKAMEAPSLYARVYDLIFNSPDRFLSNKLQKLTEGTVGQLSKKEFEEMPDDTYGRVTYTAKTIAMSLVNPTYTKVMGAVASSYGIKPDGTIREIVGGLFQSGPVQRAAEFLVLQAGYIDKFRNEQIGLTRDSVLYMFKEAPTRAEEEAMTEVLADTQLASLFGKNTAAFNAGLVKNRIYNNATLRKILTDEETLDKFIVEAKRALKDLDPKHYNWHSNQAVGLGIYMATHQGTPEQNHNAQNIAEGIHSNHTKRAKPEVVKAIEELATLTAIKNTESAPRELVADLMKRDYEAVQHVADVVEGFRKNSIEAVFKENQRNMIMGYTREVFDDSILIEVAPLSEQAKMEAQGFKLQGKLAPKLGNTQNEPMALYVTDSASRPDRLRGGVRLNQMRAKGTTITSAKYKEGEGLSTSLVREMAQRDINKVQREAQARIKKMEEGEYNFTDTVFGVMPLLNEQGKVVDYRYMMDKKTKKQLLKQETRISEVMAKSFGTLIDKDMTAKHNNEVLKTLKADMYENWEKGTKGKDGLTDFTLVGPNVSDPEMRKLYYMLPKEFQQFIQAREDKTLAVRTELKNLYFGYSQLSIANFPMLKKFTPAVILRGIRLLETFWMEFVQIAKTNILMKMPTVTLSNFFANVIFLTMKGYNPVEIISMQVDSFRTIKAYNKDLKRKQELLNREREIKVALGRKVLSDSRTKELQLELKRAQGELVALENSITGSRVHELIQMGLDQSVEDLSANVVRDTNRISTFFDEKLDKLPSVARTGVDYLFLTKRTVPYQVVNEFLEITDLMSRDIQNTLEQRSEKRQVEGQELLPNWWLEGKPKGYKSRQRLTGDERVEFLRQAEQVRKYELVEDYINYALPSSQFEEYLNKVGILMFTKYVKRIQRIITKTGSRGPIKSLIALFGVSVLGGLPTIHDQSFLAKDWYTDSIGPGNVFPIYSPVDVFMNVITPSLLKSSTYDFSL
jgi:hypothetical protein